MVNPKLFYVAIFMAILAWQCDTDGYARADSSVDLKFKVEPALSSIQHNTLLCVRLTLLNRASEKAILPAPLGCAHGSVMLQLRHGSGDWFQVRAVGQDQDRAVSLLPSQELLPNKSFAITESIPFSLRNAIFTSGQYRMRAIIVYPDAPQNPEFISVETTIDIHINEQQRAKPSSAGWKALCEQFRKGAVLPMEDDFLKEVARDTSLSMREKRLLQWFAALPHVFKGKDKETNLAQLQKCRENAEAFDPITRDFLRYKLGYQAAKAKDLQTCCTEMLNQDPSSREWQSLRGLVADSGFRCENGIPILLMSDEQ
jgi:hypothetical protein